MHMARAVDTIVGDREKRFESLFHSHYWKVVRQLALLLGSEAEAEEQAQETFLRLYDSSLLERPNEEVSAWLRRVALNRGYNCLRGHRRELERLQSESRLSRPLAPDRDADPEDEALRSESTTQVRLALAKLTARQQSCLLLRYEGMSYKNIAKVLGVAPGSVGTLLARAEKAFREHYEG
ncbi:MAG: sigma-70 family RNA polymerase sigma factor [Chloroflexota bacterium]|nr:MAG: sigma-70 family RNA polymerase sigma factor [Chloroflexota bacterium]